MAKVTVDDIRVLARSGAGDPVLVLLDDNLLVLPVVDTMGAHAAGEIVYTRDDLLREYGEQINDVDAEVLAAGLTAQLGG
jgi:hypothetical protein